MDERALYLALMAGCVVLTLPLEFVFRARVWRRPARLAAALVPTVALFLVWDAYAIAQTHWFFNPRFVTGWRIPFRIPVEELAFFVVIPICGLLTFESVRRMLGDR